MTLRELTDEFLLYLSAVRGLSENTVIGYGNDLSQLLEFLTPELDVKSVTRENLMLCIGQLSRQKKSDMDNRLAIINKYENAVALSIHQNQFTDPKFCGAQMFYSQKSEAAHALAEAVKGRIVSTLQPENKREIKLCGKELFLCYYSKNPTVMVECGFLSNPEEAALLNTEEYQEKVALTIFDGINSYINGK